MPAGAGTDSQRYLVRLSAAPWNGSRERVASMLHATHATAGAQLSYTLSASMQSLAGECNSYHDCMPAQSSAHPSKATDRASDSANGD